MAATAKLIQNEMGLIEDPPRAGSSLHRAMRLNVPASSATAGRPARPCSPVSHRYRVSA